MTVNTTNITSGPYSGNGVADTFSYTFRIENKNQLRVFETDDAGVETELTVDTDYTVAGIGNDAGGTVTRVAGALPTGFTWYIRSNYVETQVTDFQSQGAFFPQIHELAMDKLTFLIQQIIDRLGRSIKLSDSYSGSADPTLPNPAALNYIRWNAAGTGFENSAGTANGELIEFFDTVADMVASAGLVQNKKAFTFGYNIPGDGGSNFYDIVAGGTGVADGGSFIDLNNGLQAKGLFPNGFIFANQFGAVGDGVTDDTSAIQTTVDYAESLTDGLVSSKGVYALLLGQEYYISSPIILRQGNVSLVGVGPKGTVIRSDQEIEFFTVGDTTLATNTFNFALKGMTLRATNLASVNTVGVASYAAVNFTMEDVIFRDLSYGFYGHRCGQATNFDRCWFLTTNRTTEGFASIFLDGDPATGTPSSGVHVTDCEFWGVNGYIGGTTPSVEAHFRIRSCDGLYVTNCHSYFSRQNVQISPTGQQGSMFVTDLMFTNCYFDTVLENQVAVTGQTADVVGNYIYQNIRFGDCIFRNSVTGLLVSITTGTQAGSVVRDFKFTGCQFSTFSGSAISISGPTSAGKHSVSGVSIVGCTFAKTTGSIVIFLDCESATIVGNTFSEENSAPTACVSINHQAETAGDFDGFLVSNNNFFESLYTDQLPIKYSDGPGVVSQSGNLTRGPGAHTLDTFRLQTTDGTATAVWSEFVPSGSSGLLKATVVGRNASGDTYCVYEMRQAFTRTNAGTLSLLGTKVVGVNQISGLGTPNITAGSTTIFAFVTGAAATTVDWVVTIEFTMQGD